MGSTGLHKWTKVIVPTSLPLLVSGMKQGWAFARRSPMAAEIYVTMIERFLRNGWGTGLREHPESESPIFFPRFFCLAKQFRW
jgi:ABC-type anion transport system duplicated permease subunit